MNRRICVALTIALIAALPSFADDGATIYKSKCAMCHGADGKGMTPVGKSLKMRDLTSEEVQKLTDKEIATVIAEGKGKMPAFKSKLSAAEIDGQVKVVRSLKK